MANQVTIKNKTAHVKQLQLGNGQSITIPPTAEGSPGLTVTFDNDKERERFEAALGSKVIKRWIERKELEIESGKTESSKTESGTTEPASPGSKQPAPPLPPPPAPSSAEPTPSRHFGRRGDRE